MNLYLQYTVYENLQLWRGQSCVLSFSSSVYIKLSDKVWVALHVLKTHWLDFRKCSEKKSSTHVIDIQIFRDQKLSVYDYRTSADINQCSSRDITWAPHELFPRPIHTTWIQHKFLTLGNTKSYHMYFKMVKFHVEFICMFFTRKLDTSSPDQKKKKKDVMKRTQKEKGLKSKNRFFRAEWRDFIWIKM